MVPTSVTEKRPRAHFSTAMSADDVRRFEALFRSQFTPVARSAFLVLRDRSAAEDIAQDAFAQLYRHWPKVSSYERPDAWLRRIAIRSAVRAARRRETLDRLVRLFQREASTASTNLDLQAALGRLSAHQRGAIALHYYQDLPMSDVAAALGCSQATAKVHLFRARRRLAQLLGEPETGDFDVD
jgi:RNA polymerase sigma-70 factor (ECF subfamily)